MTNRFRNPVLRREYDAIMFQWRTKHRNLFYKDQPHIGSTISSYFWNGYNGVNVGRFAFREAASKQILAYAYYRAGQDARKEVEAQSNHN